MIGAYQRATNRLLPYRALHTDLVAHEEYYTFNDPTVLAFDDWTRGSNGSLSLGDPGDTPYFDGEPTWSLSPLSPATDDTSVYVESAVSNLNSIPTTFRVVARSNDANWWIRIYDPNRANYGLWVDLANGVLGTIGSAVIEARIKVPDGTTQSGTGNPGSSAPGEANGFWQIDFELPAASPLTMRIQLVDGDGETNFTGLNSELLFIARAEALNGTVSKWTCRRTGRTFSQSVQVRQPYARPMGVPQFNGRRVLKFDGGQYLVSDDPASRWDFLHSGAPCSVYAAYMPTTASDSRLMSTSDGVSEGFRIRTDIDADARTGVVVWNDSDTLVASLYSSIGTTPINSLYVAGYRGQDGHPDGEAMLDVGGAQYVIGNTGEPWGSSGAPTTTLQIGAENGVNGFDGYIADIAIYDDRLTDDEHARVVEELEALNATSQSIPGCICWVRAGEQVDEPLTTWGDLSGNGNNITGALGNFPELIDSSPSFRGSPSVLYEEADRSLGDAAASEIADLTADHAVIMTCQVTALTAGIDIIWVFQNSGDIEQYELFGVSSGAQWRYERGADGGGLDLVDVGTADAKPHVHSFVLASGERSSYVDGSPLFEGVASTPGTMGTDQLTIGANRAGSLGSSLSVSEIAVYNQAPTTYQRQLVERAQRRRMLGGMSLKLGYSLGAITPLSSAADLLSVAQSLGFELFLDMYTEGGYALSGSTIVSLKNRITDTDVSVFGSPQFSATGLNGGPACIFDGLLTRFLGTDVTALARMTDNTPFTLIYVAGWDVPDSSSTMFSVGTPSSSVPFRRFGTADTGTGRHAATFISDGSAETVQVFDDTNGRLDAPHIVEWDFDGSTITMRLDRQATGVTNVPYTNSGLTPTKWVWGCLSRNNNTQIHDGPGSLLLLGPQLSSGQKDTLYAAIAAHHSALAGLLA